jgi:hypothetical protein
MAADERTGYLGQVRLCDSTGCYLAWSVVDSDHDGVSDADELMAGTDPYNPASRPLLAPLVELAQDRRLPSFEAGLGSFVAFPAEIIEARDKFVNDPLAAFPVNTRGDTLTKLGISVKQLTEYGIDPSRDGFTIGLEGPAADGSTPAARIGGIDARLISAGSDAVSTAHGGVKSDWTVADGDKNSRTRTFNDGVSETETIDPATGDKTNSMTNPDGSAAGPTTQSRDYMDGDVQVHEEKTIDFDENGNVSAVSYVTTHFYKDGSSSTLTEATFFARDEQGNVTSQLKVDMVEHTNADGSYTAGATTSECGADGTNCTEIGTETVGEYINSDADTGGASFEVFNNVLLMRGATVTVVAGWTAPVLDGGPRNPGDPGVIALVDAELGQVMLQLQPDLVTTAQPETNPDLPNPRTAAPTGSGGACELSCQG